MKKALVILEILLICFLLTACGEKAKLEMAAGELSNAAQNGDLQAIGNILAGGRAVSPYEEAMQQLSEYESESNLQEEQPGQESILSRIIKKDTIEVISGKIGSVTLEITAPDLSGVLQNEDVVQLNAEELYNYLAEYIENAEQETTLVMLPYEIKNKKAVIYYEQDFLNVLTGGFLESYQNLYNEWITEYLSKVS